jgi:hypothetical protein
MSESVIRIDAVEPRGNVLTIRHSHEGPVGKVMNDTPLRLVADHPLDSIPPGILVIPLLGGLVPLSWIVDCHIVAGDVDEAYLEALAEVRGVMEKAFPALKFRGSIEARPVRSDSAWNPDKYCLLYSGGVDSTTSYVRNRDRNPALLMVKGTPDVRLSETEYWQRTMERIPPALSAIKAELHVVETNSLDIIDERALRYHVHTEEISGWWENFAHGLFLTSTCAPFTYFSNTGKLLIASSYTPATAKPIGSMPESDEKIRWGGLRVIHDSFDISRFEKIRDHLSPFIQSQGGAFPIKLCLGKEKRLSCGKLNCGLCDKCLTTELMFLETGIDPSRCDFDMSKFSPSRVRAGLENGYIKMPEAPNSWRYIIQNARPIRPELAAKYRGVDDFLAWISKWDQKPKESALRSYSKKVAPAGSRRRRLAKRVLRRD